MARDWVTTYSTNVAANTHTVAFTSPAIVGRKLVGIAAAPAGITFPAGWSDQVTSSNKGVLKAATLTAAGGETQAVLTLTPAGATRCLIAWDESRDDLGAIDGTPVQAAVTTTGATSVTIGSVTTSQPNSRIYAAVVQVGSTGATFNAWTPTWPSYLTAEPVLVSTGGGNEPVRMTVASGVAAAAGAYTITVTGLASLPSGHAYQGIAFAFAPIGDPPPPAETLIEAENRLAGTAKSVWDITGAGAPSIQGFATATSVNRGSTLSVKVHSPSAAWTGKVYRLGYYAGLGAREVATITGTQTTQPSGTTDPTTGMVSCANWTINGSWVVPADATPGVYLIKISRNDNSALASHIGPFVVCNPARKAPIVVKTSDTTWQAYNHAGANPADPFAGANLYGVGTATEFTFNTGARCKAISYDRPLVTRQFIPQTHFFNAEYPMVRWLERLGYDVDYVSTLDVDADASLLLGRQIVVSSGHDEYWSARVRDAFVAARDAGVHLAFLSGNEAFWRVNPTSPGGREFACWKDSLSGSLNSSGVYSGTWQDTRSFNPDRRPAALLNGQRFRLNGQSAYSMAVPDTYKASPLWRNTAVAQLAAGQTWTSPVGIVGFEADEPADMNPAEKPAGLIRLSQATYQVTAMLSDDNGADYTGSGPYTHAMTAYRASSGAVVFHTGTVQYAWGLDETHDRHPGGTLATPVLQQALSNVLADLGQVPPAYPFPSGLVRPAGVALSAYGLSSLTPGGDGGATTTGCETWPVIWPRNADGTIDLPLGAETVTGTAVDMATEVLYALTARRFGLCSLTLRPCKRECYNSSWWSSSLWLPFTQTITPRAGSYWLGMTCGGCGSDCSCTNVSEVALPGPVYDVTQVKVNGIILTKNVDYRLDSNRLLVRLGNEWPSCNDLNLADTAQGTWSVTAQIGEPVPTLGQVAVGELATQFVHMLLDTGDCMLPKPVQSISRQGVNITFLDPNEVFANGRIGLYVSDLFIQTYNPDGRRNRAKVYNIDALSNARRVGS